MDEIGGFEFDNAYITKCVFNLLDKDKPIIGVIKSPRSKEIMDKYFPIDSILMNKDRNLVKLIKHKAVEIIHVNNSNKNEIQNKIIKNLKKNILFDINYKLEKNRYWKEKKMIMQLNHIKSPKKSIKNFQNFLIKKIKSEKNGRNIIFSDYRNGIFDKEHTKKIIKILKSKNNIIFVDQQSTTKKPDLLKFKNADYLILNEYEFRKAFKKYKINNLNFENSLKVLRIKIGINNFIIKMGKKGSSYFTEGTFVKVKAYKTAKNLNTIGAGDFFLAKFATLEKKTIRDKLYEANKFAYKKISNKIKIKSIRI